MSALLVFGSTFMAVFFLGLQSLNVNQGRYVAAAVTSFFISTGHIWLYKTMPNPSGLDFIGYYLGGIVGIVTSMWFHRVVRAQWPAFVAWLRAKRCAFKRTHCRAEHADTDFCGLVGTDFTKGDKQ